MTTDIKLSKSLLDQRGQFQYQEALDGDIQLSALNASEVWTIKKPSQALKDACGSLEVRMYGDTEFVLSPRAASVFPLQDNAGGSGAVIRFKFRGQYHFIAVVDNKDYFMGAGGSSNPGETAEECLRREVREELAIEVQDQQVRSVGKWAFSHKIPILDFESKRETAAFLVDVSVDQLDHLISPATLEDLHASGHTMVLASDLECPLDETVQILFCGKEFLSRPPVPFEITAEGTPRTAMLKSHHLEFFRVIAGLPSTESFSYLSEFSISAPEDV